MRGVVWFVLLFVVAVVAATVLGRNDGLVTLAWGGWRVELALNLFVALLALGFVGLTMLLRGVQALLTLPERARQWRELQRERAGHAALRDAQIEYFNARYSRAHKAAQRAMAIHDQASPGAEGVDPTTRALAHLLAAASLHRLLDRPRRDAVLERMAPLLQGPGVGPVAQGAQLMAAEWALDDHRAEHALSLLGSLPPGVARRTQALRLRLRAAQMARRPLDALHTARLLAKHQAFSAAGAQGLLRTLATEVLDATHDAEQLRREWLQLDPADRRDPRTAVAAARRAISLGASGDARAWLAPHWDQLAELPRDEAQAVALALADASVGIGVDWLPRIERALHNSPGDPAVQAAAGQVLAARGLWGKARPLLEASGQATSLPATTRRQAWRRLAALAREQGQPDQAARCEQQAAQCD